MPCIYTLKDFNKKWETGLTPHFAAHLPEVWPLRERCLVPRVPIGGCSAWLKGSAAIWCLGISQAHVGILGITISRACKIWDITDNVTPLYLQMNEPESPQRSNKRSPSHFETLFPSQDLNSIKIRRLWCHRRLWCIKTKDNNGNYLGLSWTTGCDN